MEINDDIEFYRDFQQDAQDIGAVPDVITITINPTPELSRENENDW